MSAWQQMDTAPKDGTIIIIWARGKVHTASWRNTADMPRLAGAVARPSQLNLPDGEWTDTHRGQPRYPSRWISIPVVTVEELMTEGYSEKQCVKFLARLEKQTDESLHS